MTTGARLLYPPGKTHALDQIRQAKIMRFSRCFTPHFLRRISSMLGGSVCACILGQRAQRPNTAIKHNPPPTSDFCISLDSPSRVLVVSSPLVISICSQTKNEGSQLSGAAMRSPLGSTTLPCASTSFRRGIAHRDELHSSGALVCYTPRAREKHTH